MLSARSFECWIVTKAQSFAMAALLVIWFIDGRLNGCQSAIWTKRLVSLVILGTRMLVQAILSASNRARLPAEFKHINKRRKRKQL